MPAVDAKQYNLSHFDNSDIWFKASNDQNVKTGWLGRWIDRNGNGTNPLQAISIDTALSKSIRTADQPGVRDPVAADGGLHAQLRRAIGGVEQPQPQHDDARPVRAAARATDNALPRRARASTYGLAVETWQRLSAITSATRRRPRRRSAGDRLSDAARSSRA